MSISIYPGKIIDFGLAAHRLHVVEVRKSPLLASFI
jgi:hypothetical protein